jgi:hypothetical protein
MSDYHAYLIRLWRDDQHEPWRAELVSPHTGEERRFATPEQLFSYVQEQMEGITARSARPNPSQELV